ERLRLAEASSAAVRNCVPPKLDEPRLLGMKIQAKTSEPRLEVGKELLCFVPMLEANDGVVRVAHDNHVSGGASLPPLVDLVEKGLNAAIEYPVDPPLPDPERERIQRLMLVTLRSETVAEAQELRLIDRRQDCHYRSLDNLVLYGSDAKRPLSAIRLRYVLPA